MDSYTETLDETSFRSLLKKVYSERTVELGMWDAGSAVRRRLANNESHARGYENWLDAYNQLIEE